MGCAVSKQQSEDGEAETHGKLDEVAADQSSSVNSGPHPPPPSFVPTPPLKEQPPSAMPPPPDKPAALLSPLVAPVAPLSPPPLAAPTSPPPKFAPKDEEARLHEQQNGLASPLPPSYVEADPEAEAEAEREAQAEAEREAEAEAQRVAQTEAEAEAAVEDPLYQFPRMDLERATNGFSQNGVLGEGGFGMVYHGRLPNPDGMSEMEIAVKRLKREGVQGVKELKKEIFILGRLTGHPSLVRLIGYCVEDGDFMLVYEYMPNGSLDYHLFPVEGDEIEPLTWQQRLIIAVQVCRGLAYLHSEKVVHRDVKASNVLLDAEFNAKVTDFGLAREFDDKTFVATFVVGSEGYADPSYIQTGQLSKKSDVYAFGMLILEMVTGRNACRKTWTGERVFLVDHVNERRLAHGEDNELEAWNELMDPRLPQPFPPKLLKRLVGWAFACLVLSPRSRPDMADVLEALEILKRKSMPGDDS